MRTWWAGLAVCAGLALPTAIWPGTSGADYAYLAGLVVVVASLWWGAFRATGYSRSGWSLIAVAASCWLIGDVVERVLSAFGYPTDQPGPPDVFWLSSYGLLTVAVLLIIKGRGVAADDLRDLRLDTATVTIAVAVGTWQVMIAPSLAGGQLDLATVLAALYPLGDVAVFAMGLSLLLAPGSLGVPGYLLIGALGSSLGVDGLISVLLTTGAGINPERLDAALLVVNALLGAAALHPQAPRIAQTEKAIGDRHMRRYRTIMLGTSLFVVCAASALPGSHSLLDRSLLLAAAVAVSSTVVARFYGVVRQREAAEARLAHLAHHDQLTGLPNRTRLIERLIDIGRPSDHRLGHLALLYLDLDGFKVVNDTYGHAAGDRVLQTVSNRLINAVRQGDLVARLGGDEFVVGCVGLPPEAAHQLAHTLVDVVGQPITLPLGTDVQIGVSVGVHTVALEAPLRHQSQAQIERLLQAADFAMYEAKHSGGGVRAVAPSSSA